MKRTISSESPLGALILSISVVNPYLYLSTSISRTRSMVSCTGVAICHSPFILCRPPDLPAGANFRKNGQEPLDIRLRRVPAGGDAKHAGAQVRRNAHSIEHKRPLDLTGGAG